MSVYSVQPIIYSEVAPIVHLEYTLNYKRRKKCLN